MGGQILRISGGPTALLSLVWDAWSRIVASRQSRHAMSVASRLLSQNEQLLQDAGRLPLDLAVRALDAAIRRARARRVAYGLYVLGSGRSRGNLRACASSGSAGDSWDHP